MQCLIGGHGRYNLTVIYVSHELISHLLVRRFTEVTQIPTVTHGFIPINVNLFGPGQNVITSKASSSFPCVRINSIMPTSVQMQVGCGNE